MGSYPYPFHEICPILHITKDHLPRMVTLFLFSWITSPATLYDFGKSQKKKKRKKKKEKKRNKSQKMLAGHDKNRSICCHHKKMII